MNSDKDKVLSEDSKEEKEFQKAMTPVFKSNRLLIHIMANNNREVALVKSKIYNQEFMWNKRMYPIDKNGFIADKKGYAHYYQDVNESTGMLTFNKSYIDQCVKCSNKIGQDAVNTRDLLKRRTISAIWGIDNSHILLLMIMGIVLVVIAGILFYVYGQNQQLTEKLEQYLPKPVQQVPHMLLPLVINHGGITS